MVRLGSIDKYDRNLRKRSEQRTRVVIRLQKGGKRGGWGEKLLAVGANWRAVSHLVFLKEKLRVRPAANPAVA